MAIQPLSKWDDPAAGSSEELAARRLGLASRALSAPTKPREEKSPWSAVFDTLLGAATGGIAGGPVGAVLGGLGGLSGSAALGGLAKLAGKS